MLPHNQENLSSMSLRRLRMHGQPSTPLLFSPRLALSGYSEEQSPAFGLSISGSLWCFAKKTATGALYIRPIQSVFEI